MSWKLTRDLFALVVVSVIVVLALAYGPSLPELVPSHFDLQGNIDHYMPRSHFLLMIVGLTVGLYLVTDLRAVYRSLLEENSAPLPCADADQGFHTGVCPCGVSPDDICGARRAHLRKHARCESGDTVCPHRELPPQDPPQLVLRHSHPLDACIGCSLDEEPHSRRVDVLHKRRAHRSPVARRGRPAVCTAPDVDHYLWLSPVLCIPFFCTGDFRTRAPTQQLIASDVTTHFNEEDRMKTTISLLCGLVLLIRAHPQCSRRQEWQGTGMVPLRFRVLDLGIAVHFTGQKDSLQATIDIPMQMAKGLPLKNVRVQLPSVHFELPAGPGPCRLQRDGGRGFDRRRLPAGERNGQVPPPPEQGREGRRRGPASAVS